ncbi:MAG: hypothetical protein B9S32_04700 [Verrucomicrobia bacterium Tous-C9LFEB]|nr:MAG: hypothetical protein B9S32_04700 [Verrucomicrobia bacterium Tous-C9LFEB]
MTKVASQKSQWQWKTMGDITEIVGGGTPKTTQSEYFGGDVPWITPADLSGYTDKEISRGTRNITQEGLANSGARLMPKGTVLFSSRAPIGYVAIAANSVSTSQGFKSFIPQKGISSDFLYYYLQHAKKFAVELASGTTFLEISGKKAAQIPVPVVPFNEQKQIVAEIEKQFTRLDAGVKALKRVQANLKRYRASVLKAACEGRLVPTEHELARKEGRTYETGEQLLTRILTERRQNWQGRGKYKEPITQTASLTPLPKGWTWSSIAQISFLDIGYAFKSAEFAKSGEIRLLRGENIEPGKLRWLDTRYWPKSKLHEFQNLLLREGDIVLAMDRPLISSGLKIAQVTPFDLPCLLVQRMARFQLVDELMTKYLFITLNTNAFIKHLLGGQTGTQLPHVSGDGIQSFLVPLPPLAEQKRIVAEVERRLSVIDELEAIVSANLQRATRLRQSILRKSFLGKE